MTAYLLIAPMLLGVDVGWQPLPEGGMEYIIQIDPGTLEAMKQGDAVQSDIPEAVGRVRAYRVIVGSGGGLPKEKPLPDGQPDEATSPDEASAATAADVAPALKNEPATLQVPAVAPNEPERLTTFRSHPVTAAEAKQYGPVAVEQPNTPKQLSDESKEAPADHARRAAADDTKRAPTDPATDRPWWALMITLAALAGSLTGNVYLFWILREAHRRYRRLVRKSEG